MVLTEIRIPKSPHDAFLIIPGVSKHRPCFQRALCKPRLPAHQILVALHPLSKTFVGLNAAHHARHCFHGLPRYPFHLVHGHMEKGVGSCNGGPPTSEVSFAGGDPQRAKSPRPARHLQWHISRCSTRIHACPCVSLQHSRFLCRACALGSLRTTQHSPRHMSA